MTLPDVYKRQGLMHVVGDHQAGDLFLGHDALGQLQHLLRRGRVQGCGVLVQQQELGGKISSLIK